MGHNVPNAMFIMVRNSEWREGKLLSVQFKLEKMSSDDNLFKK